MRSNYKKLGEYIRQVDERNSDNTLGEDNLYGISVTKEFIITHANLVGVTFDSYKVVSPKQFAYIPDTSRRGDKIAISLNTFDDRIIVSSICSVFEVVDENKLLPEYLMLWFMRPEFDRYARFMSNGSAREVFDWDCMCGVELPVLPIDEQRRIVHDYKVITDRIELLQKINDNLDATLSTIFSNIISQTNSNNVSLLCNLISFGNGKTRPQELGKIPVYGGNGVLSYTEMPNANNVVLIGRVGAYCGSVYLETNDCWVSDNAIYAKSKISDKEYFDYYLLKNLNLYNYHVGTGQQLLTQEILNKIPITTPSEKDIIRFNCYAEKVYSNLVHNKAEITELQSIADLLLSKLSA